LYTAPDGTLTAEKLCESTAASTQHFTAQSNTSTSSLSYTLSAYLKAAERTYAAVYAGTPGQGKIFDLSNGTVYGDAIAAPASWSISSVGNGWYRCSITYVASGATTAPSIYLCDPSAGITYTGDGSSGIYVYGAQFEQVTSVQPTPQAYVATTSAAYYGPRFDYDATNVVSQNLLLYSQQLNNSAGWTTFNYCTVTGNVALAPDNTKTASYFAATAVNTIHRAGQNVNLVVGQKYTFSIYAKASSYERVSFIDNYWGAYTAVFSLATGTIVSTSTCTATITPVGTDGWYYCTATFTATHTDCTPAFASIPSASSNDTFLGDGVSGGYFWGAQLNNGVSALPYVATTSAPYTQVGIKGLLIEEGRTNVALYSQQFDNATGWVKTNSTVTVGPVSPDGTANAYTFASSGALPLRCDMLQTNTASATGKTVSIYAKAGTGNYIQLFFGTDTNPWANFDLVNGVVGSTGTTVTASIQNVGNGWYRCVAATTSTTATDFAVMLAASASATRASTISVAANVSLWGAQIEVGAFATSYIPTTSASVARAADNASMTGTNFSSWFNASAGTFAVQYVLTQISTSPVVLGLQAGGTGFNGANGTSESWWNGSTNITTANSVAFGSTRKAGFAYTASTRAIVLNAGTVATDANVPWSVTPTSAYLGSISGANVQNLNGWIKAITFYPRAFSNTELQSVTS
jgi:hypothetical protein